MQHTLIKNKNKKINMYVFDIVYKYQKTYKKNSIEL